MTTVGNTFAGSSGRKTFKALLKSLLPYSTGEAPGDSRAEIDTYSGELQADIDNHRYAPSSPRGEMVFAKAHGVPRFITFPTFRDQCVYHHCIYQLEKSDKFIERVSNTFGGWHLPHPHRKHETADVDKLEDRFSETYLDSPYWSSAVSPLRYRRIWKEYGYSVYLNSMELQGYAAVHIDIANFYDSIDLHRLERLIRSNAAKDMQPIVDLLFHFLRGYDRRSLGYSVRTVGLPHEELTETSRVLCNLYLAEYDQIMNRYCAEQDPEYRYMRYSDDQLFFVPTVDAVPAVVYRAGKELHKLGLNINASKVRVFSSMDEIDDHWKFSIYNESVHFADHQDASEICRYYLNRKKSRPDSSWRHDMIRNAIIHAMLAPWKDWEAREEFIWFILDHPTELYSFTHYQLSRIYSASSPEQRRRLVSWLAQTLLSDYPFTSFRLHAVRFLQDKRVSEESSGLSDSYLECQIDRCRL